jgi:hypothetical protein
MSKSNDINKNEYSERYEYWHKVIDTLIREYKSLYKVCEAANKSGTLDPNGPLFEAIWSSFESLLNIFDKEGWISWYIYDNECGKRKLKASYGKNKPVKIDSNLKLVDLIIETEKSETCKK